jgi:hypothetical protein
MRKDHFIPTRCRKPGAAQDMRLEDRTGRHPIGELPVTSYIDAHPKAPRATP